MKDSQYIGSDQISVSPFSNTYLDARTGGKGWVSPVDENSMPSIKVDLSPNGGTQDLKVTKVGVTGNVALVRVEVRNGDEEFRTIQEETSPPIEFEDSFKASALRITLLKPSNEDDKTYNVTVSITGCFKETRKYFFFYFQFCMCDIIVMLNTFA